MEPFTWSEGNELVAQHGGERFAVDRVRSELGSRGWSQSQLSRRLADLGDRYRMHPSVISRLLNSKSTEPRALSVDQIIGLAKVLGVPFGELLLPPGAREVNATWQDIRAAAELYNQAYIAEDRLEGQMDRLRDEIRRSPGLIEAVRQWRDDLVQDHDAYVRAQWERELARALPADRDHLVRRGPGRAVPNAFVAVCNELLAAASDPHHEPRIGAGVDRTTGLVRGRGRSRERGSDDG